MKGAFTSTIQKLYLRLGCEADPFFDAAKPQLVIDNVVVNFFEWGDALIVEARVGKLAEDLASRAAQVRFLLAAGMASLRESGVGLYLRPAPGPCPIVMTQSTWRYAEQSVNSLIYKIEAGVNLVDYCLLELRAREMTVPFDQGKSEMLWLLSK